MGDEFTDRLPAIDAAYLGGTNVSNVSGSVVGSQYTGGDGITAALTQAFVASSSKLKTEHSKEIALALAALSSAFPAQHADSVHTPSVGGNSPAPGKQV